MRRERRERECAVTVATTTIPVRVYILCIASVRVSKCIELNSTRMLRSRCWVNYLFAALAVVSTAFVQRLFAMLVLAFALCNCCFLHRYGHYEWRTNHLWCSGTSSIWFPQFFFFLRDGMRWIQSWWSASSDLVQGEKGADQSCIWSPLRACCCARLVFSITHHCWWGSMQVRGEGARDWS